MKLVICEKPDIGKAFAEGLPGGGRMVRDKGLIEAGEYTITWCFGHLLSLVEPGEIDKKYDNKADISLLPIYFENWKRVPTLKTSIDYRTRQEVTIDHRLRVKQIVDLINQADCIIHAGDMDEEGEQLIYEVIEYSKTTKPIYRVSTADLSVVGMQKAIKDIKPYSAENRNSAKTADARSVCDLFVGINYSRLLSHIHGFGMSVGRVQSPTLAMVVNRDLAISNHVKEKFYTLYANTDLVKDKVDFQFMPNKEFMGGEQRILDKDKYNPVIGRVDKKGVQVLIERKKSKQNAPLTFNSLELQVYMSKKFKWALNKTDKTTQILREKYKAITYNRSDCRYLGDVHHSEAPRVLGQVMSNLGAKYPLDFSLKSPAFNNSLVTAHHGIIPTGQIVNVSALTDDERLCYKVICERYMMQFLPPMIKERISATFEDQDGIFSASDTTILDKGYAGVFGEVDEDDEDEETANAILKTLKDGIHNCNVTNCFVEESETKALQPYTEASLAKDMCSISKYVKDERIKKLLLSKDAGKKGENGSIGTSATRGAIIFGLIQKGYLEEVKGKIRATQKGYGIYDAMPNDFKTPEMTAEFWALQEQIKDGEIEKDVFEKAVVEKFNQLLANKDEFKKTTTRSERPVAASSVLGNCPNCGAPVVETKDYYRCVNYKKEGHDCGVIVGKTAFGAKLSATEMKKVLAGKPTKLLKMVSKAGKNFDAHLKYHTENKRIEVIFPSQLNGGGTQTNGEPPKPEVAEKCSCGGNLVKKSGQYGYYYACDKDHKGKYISATYCGHEITHEELRQMLQGEEIGPFEMVSKQNKKFSAKMKLSSDCKVELVFLPRG